MKKCQLLLTCIAATLTMVVAVGCGNNKTLSSTVKGTVTANGSPVPAGLQIQFQPVGDGPTSFGSTNSQGQYELSLNPKTKGAHTGENIVSVQFTINEGEDDPGEQPSFKILKAFRDPATHKVTVNKGQNTIDLEIVAE